MLIELKKIVEGGLRVDQEIRLGSLPEDEEIEELGPAQVDLDLREMDGDIVVSGTYRSRVKVPCARCLKSFDMPLEASFTSIFRPPPSEFPEEAEVEERDLDLSYLEPDQETLDVSGVVREQVLLSVPMKPLHSEECKGLCPRCGIDRNEKSCECPDRDLDPRLEALADIRAAMETSDED